MRILLLHPDDVRNPGPWTAQAWGLVVNLGRSPLLAEKPAFSCPILHVDRFGKGLADAGLVRELLRVGRGVLIDREGLDWWELTSVNLVQHAFAVLQLQRAATEIPASPELWCTRPDWSANVLAQLLRVDLKSFRLGKWARVGEFARHYAQVFHRFSAAQIRQIVFDKYDPAYRWRSRFAAKPDRCSKPVVLIPSAYANVSRMAAAYVSLIPDQPCLLVATRHSAYEFLPTKNIEVHDLAAYARVQPQRSELAFLMERWTKLKSDLHSCQGLQPLLATGILDSLTRFYGTGLSVRDAWAQVLERQTVLSVLCGDDSNLYTRLPMLLAARRNIPTVDFHHGALDGFYLFKDLDCDLYLAKSEMERDYLLRLCQLPETKIVIAPPLSPQISSANVKTHEGRSIVLFSEPYEIGGIRAEDVYGEVLPRLWLLASRYGRELVIKLHPFESRSQRGRIVERVLLEASSRVRWVEGPLTSELFERAWFGLTIESTTAIDCAQNGVCCFLCGWLNLLPYGYAEQYIRFGMGEPLENPSQIEEIPGRLKQFHNRMSSKRPPSTDVAQLRQWFASGFQGAAQSRSAS